MFDKFKEDVREEGRVNKKLKFFFVGVFFILLFALIYTSFSGNMSITGNFIGVKIDNETGFSILTDLTVPCLNLEGEFRQVKIKGTSKGFFYVGDEIFSLKNLSENYIVLNNYDGDIYFDENIVSELNGKADRISFNGISITSRDILKVRFDDDFEYDELEIVDGVFIRELDYVTSGVIKLNKETSSFSVDNENIFIENFQGGFKIKDDRFQLDGFLKSLSKKGEQDIFISV